MRRKILVGVLTALLLSGLVGYSQAASKETKAPEPSSPPKKHGEFSVPPQKQTTLGLYVTAKEAFAMWHKNPAEVKVLDCRTPEEYNFVGHAPMATNIPSKFMTYKWDEKKKSYVMKDNPDFVSEVKKIFGVDDTILVMCRSGDRSTISANKLAEAGFKKVYNILDGFEGDVVKDAESYFDGKRKKNGWKNSGAPWGYALDPKLMYLPKQE